MLNDHRPRADTPPYDDPCDDRLHAARPMVGLVNGVIGSLALWALIAGVVVVSS